MADALHAIFAHAGRSIPRALRDWHRRLDAICDAYQATTPDAHIVEVRLDARVYAFDLALERVVVAWGLSAPPERERDAGRMAGFPDPNVGWGKRRIGASDRGHFLAHSAGGDMDINLFPQGRGLNRGWSPRGRVYRQMERYAAGHPGTFMFHQPEYSDESWIPRALVYGVLREDGRWWKERFENTDARSARAAPRSSRRRTRARDATRASPSERSAARPPPRAKGAPTPTRRRT